MNDRAARHDLGEVAARWWQALQPRSDGSGGDPGALARLRRAATITDAAFEPQAVALCRALGWNAAGLERAALAASVLAHVRRDQRPASAARQFAPVLSPLRFRRLVQTQALDDRLIAFRRAVALADRTINVADLASGLLDWSEARRRRWIFDYYGGVDNSSAENATGETVS